jgi:LysR family transcriptional regulator, glycine cleavage system transcriptional activator
MIIMRHLPPLRLFAVFEAVMRTGSPQRAAEEMNVSQPAISQAIKALENHIGAKLLDRRTRPPVLTEAGRILQRAVTTGLGQISTAIAEVNALHQMSEQSVTVACSVGTATYWLMPRLTEFYRNHPDVSVNVMTTAQGAPAFAANIDMAIRYGLGDWTDGRVIKLFEDSVVPVCHPTLLQRFIQDGKSLAGLPLLHVNSGDESWLGWRDYLRLAGLPESRVTGRNFTNYVQATQAALDGQGVMLGWQSNTADLIKKNDLVALPFLAVQPKEAFYLVIAPMSRTKPFASALADWLILISRTVDNESK